MYTSPTKSAAVRISTSDMPGSIACRSSDAASKMRSMALSRCERSLRRNAAPGGISNFTTPIPAPSWPRLRCFCISRCNRRRPQAASPLCCAYQVSGFLRRTKARPHSWPIGSLMGGDGTSERSCCGTFGGEKTKVGGEFVPRPRRLVSQYAYRWSIPVLFSLIWALNRHADVVSLLLGEFGQLHAELVEMQPGDHFIELLWKHGH